MSEPRNFQHMRHAFCNEHLAEFQHGTLSRLTMWKPVHMVDWEYICEKCGKNYEGKVKIATWVVDEEKYIKGENEP
jgi:hypothetical protein